MATTKKKQTNLETLIAAVPTLRKCGVECITVGDICIQFQLTEVCARCGWEIAADSVKTTIQGSPEEPGLDKMPTHTDIVAQGGDKMASTIDYLTQTEQSGRDIREQAEAEIDHDPPAEKNAGESGNLDLDHTD